MPSVEDIVGRTFNDLTVMALVSNCPTTWLCICTCGRYLSRTRVSLTRKRANPSCGLCRAVHDEATVSSYRAMIGRCCYPSHADWPRYGGRGISVCPEWRDSYEAFVRDAGERPSRKHSIDRIDPNGNYEPSNVRWADSRVQALNKRHSHYLEIDGTTLHIKEWSKRHGVGVSTIRERLCRGWSTKDAVCVKPLRKGKEFRVFSGVRTPLSELRTRQKQNLNAK